VSIAHSGNIIDHATGETLADNGGDGEQRIPKEHPLRRIKELAEAVLR